MRKFSFKRTTHHDTPAGDRVRREAGDVVCESDILSGCLSSMLATGDVEEVTMAAAERPDDVDPTDAIDAPKRGRGKKGKPAPIVPDDSINDTMAAAERPDDVDPTDAIDATK